jgi:polysaccharide export outer membrane protein
MLSPTKRLIRSFSSFGLIFLLVLSAFTGWRPAFAQDYVIQADDTLSIKVTGEEKLSKDYTVNEKGDVTMDLAGKVHLAGKTVKDAETAITDALKKYIKIVTVSVLVVNEIGARATVNGEVAKPGVVKVRNGTKLLDVLAETGQPTANANTKRISIARKGSDKPEFVDLDEILNDATKDVDIRAGDRITIPSKVSQSVTVTGAVTSPGAKPLETARTAYAAIQAANPKENADYSRVQLRRRGSNVPLTIDLTKVRSGDFKEDPELQEGDTLVVQSRFSGVVTLSGEVKSPGEKELTSSVQIQDVLNTQGGGLSDRANRRRVQITRDGKDIYVDLLAVENGDRRADDPELAVRPGDKIYVSSATALLQGAVKSPGNKVIGEASNIYDFIINVGGDFTENADPTRVKVSRNGKEVKEIDFTELSSGVRSLDDPELQILPGDRIFVPDSSRSSFTIVGGVQKSGRYPCGRGISLLDAIDKAGNFSERFDGKRIVVAPARLFDEEGKFKLPEDEEAPTLPENQKQPSDKKDSGNEPAANEPAQDSNAPDAKRKEDDEKAEAKRKPRARVGGKKKADVDRDPEKYGLIIVDIKKLLKGDPSQIPFIRPGDRILVPMALPRNERSNNGGGGIFGTLSRLLFFSPF